LGLPFPSYGYSHFGAISPNGLNLGLLNVNPLVAFQITKNEYGEKLLKPLVNLHVTPNENIINKVGGLLLAKKQGFKTAIFNKHQHYHNHYGPSSGPNFGPPPGYHSEGPVFEGPHPPNFGFGPGAVGPSGSGSFGPAGPPARPPPGAFGPPAAFGTPGLYGPLGPNYGGPPGFYRDAGSASGIELDYNPAAFNGSEYANQNYNDQDYNYQNYQEQQPNYDYNYQSIYPQASQGQNLQDQYSNNPTGYANSYRNYDEKADNNYNNNFQSSNSYSYPIPNPAPGAARGSKSVTFPNSRRKRDTDVPVPASLDSDDGPILAESETEDVRQATDKSEAQTAENNEKRSVNTEKVINIRVG
jgi:hypothetical protein